MFETKLKKGFTLIELLVVVSIIALLVSILLPALGKAREQAKAVLCLSNVRQMSLGLRYYAEANEDRAMTYSDDDNKYWFSEIAPLLGDKLYQDEPEARRNSKIMDISVCPSTNKRTDEEMDVTITDYREWFGTAKRTWRFYNSKAQGSLGMNLWIQQIPGKETSEYGWFGILPQENFWGRYSTIKSDTPEFGDSCWVGTWPDNDDHVPSDITNGRYWGEYYHLDRYFMGLFCLARHGMAINVSFHDGHAEKVELERLWTLRWHKNSIPNHDMVMPDQP